MPVATACRPRILPSWTVALSMSTGRRLQTARSWLKRASRHALPPARCWNSATAGNWPTRPGTTAPTCSCHGSSRTMNRNVPARHRHIGLVIHGALVAAAAFGIVTATPATANDLWSGTIGQTAVVVEFDSGTGGEDDRYFYRRHRLDLRAWGGHVRVWTEYGSGGDVPTGHWAMHPPPPAIGAAWEGSWIGRNGRALPIRLQVLAPAAEIHDAITAIPGIDAYGR